MENIFAVKYKKMNEQRLSQERKKLKTKRRGRDTELGDVKNIYAVESLRLSREPTKKHEHSIEAVVTLKWS